MGRHGLEGSTMKGRGRPEDGPGTMMMMTARGDDDDGNSARQQAWGVLTSVDHDHLWLGTLAVKWQLLLAAACEVTSLAP